MSFSMHILSFNKHPFKRINILAILRFQSNVNDHHFCLFRARLNQFSHGVVLLVMTATGTLTWFALQVWLTGPRGYKSAAPRLSLASNMSGINWPIYAQHGTTIFSCVVAHTSLDVLATVPASSPTLVLVCWPLFLHQLLHHHPHQSWGVCNYSSSHTPIRVCQRWCLYHHPHQYWGVCTYPAPSPTPVLWCLQLLFITHADQGVSTMVPVSSPTPVLVCLQLPCAITHTNLSGSAPVEYLQHHHVLAAWRPPDPASTIRDNKLFVSECLLFKFQTSRKVCI